MNTRTNGKKNALVIYYMTHKLRVITLSLLCVLLLTSGIFYAYLKLNSESDFSREMQCRITGGEWVEAGSVKECSGLDFEQCMTNDTEPTCMLWLEPVPNTAMVQSVCKPLAACKCDTDADGAYSYFGCK